MRPHLVFSLLPLLLAGGVFARAEAQAPQGPPPPPALDTIRLPSGFQIQIFAEGVPSVRSLALGDDGTVFAGSLSLFSGAEAAGNVYAIRDNDGDNKADEVITVVSGLNQPNGVAFRDGALYVAEINRILRYDGIEQRLRNAPEPVVLRDDLPTDLQHGWKYLTFGPDGKLYFGIGAPCNICQPEDPQGSISRMNPDGTGFEVFVRGVRNSVGLKFHPQTGELWFTDNGRDLLGDNVPSDELNHVTAMGQHFGYPYCHQGDVEDPEFGRPGACREYAGPAVKMGPHVASIGLEFYTGNMFPDRYRGELFVAEHGSWNRSNPLGYRIVIVHMNDGRSAAGQSIFAEGWFQNGEAWGRPVDILEMPDGSLLISDDRQGIIYRISYKN